MKRMFNYTFLPLVVALTLLWGCPGTGGDTDPVALAFSLTYDANGADEGTPPVDSSTYKSNDSVTVLGPKTLSLTGHDFDGWNTKPDGTGDSYNQGETLSITEDITLYAQWTPEISRPTYTLTYVANGAVGDVPVDPTPYVEDATVTVLGPGNLSLTGYDFDGWYTETSGTGTRYDQGDTLTITEDITLYAHWIKSSSSTYTLTYDANGATGDVPAGSGVYEKGAQVTIADQGTLSKTGHIFAGWNAKADGTGEQFAKDATLTILNNTTLYAQWTPVYTLTYDANGADGGTAPVDSTTYKENDEATVLGPGDLSRAGYDFDGWYIETDGTGTRYDQDDSLAITDNTTLYAQWARLYTLTYDANGADGGTAPVDSDTYKKDATVTVLGPGDLTRTDYDFTGWNTEPNGTGTPYTQNQLLAITDNTTLYAQWARLYTLTYDANGADSGNPPESQRSIADNNIRVHGPGNLARTGYIFVTWNTQSDGNGDDHAPASTLKMPGEDITLYAKWTLGTPDTFTLTYHPNGADSGSPPASADYEQSTQVTVAPQGNLALNDYIFVGWHTDMNGDDNLGTLYEPGNVDKEILTMPGEDTTLYAQWVRVYTLTYDANGATGGTAPVDSTPYKENDVATVLGPGDLTRTDYDFAGWNTEPDGGGTPYTQDQPLTITDNTTLYAQWARLHTLNYDANGADSGNPPESQRSIADNNIRVHGPGDLDRTGYIFDTWNTQSDGNGDDHAPASTLKMPGEDITLYAQWTPVYALNYNANGADGGTPPASAEYELNQEVIVANPGSLAKTGHHFVNWTTEVDGNGTPYNPGQTLTITADITLYAQWAPDTFTLRYHANGADGGDLPQSEDYEQGSQIVVYDNGDGVSLTGHKFDGWNTDANGNGTQYTPGQTLTMPGEDITLYAQWVPVYTITYDANGADGGSAPVDHKTYEENDVATVLGPGDLTRTDYDFADWNTEPGGGGTQYHPDQTLTMPGGNITLYAQWVRVHTITYDANGADGGSAPVDSDTYKENDQATVADKGTLTLTDYTFDGWSTTTDGIDGTQYAPGETLTMPGEDITLYAQWTLGGPPKFTLTYHANGADGTPPASADYEQGHLVTVGNGDSLSLAGHDFSSWNTQINGEGTSHYPGDTFIMPGEDTTLYAQWEEAVTSNIVFVDIDAAGTGDGTSWADAYTDLQAGIDDAAAKALNDSERWNVFVAQGTYTPSGYPHTRSDINLDTSNPQHRHFALKDNVAVYGGFAGTESDSSERDIQAHEVVISGDIDGDDDYTDFVDVLDDNLGIDVASTNLDENVLSIFINKGIANEAILNGLTLEGGIGSVSNWEGGGNAGGVLYNENAMVSCEQVIIRHSVVPLITNPWGENTTFLLKDSIVHENTIRSDDPYSAAITLYSVPVIVERTVFYNNETGSIFRDNDYGAQLELKNSIIVNNDLYDGATIVLQYDSQVTITNTSIVNNRSLYTTSAVGEGCGQRYGAAIALWDSTISPSLLLSIENSLIWGNINGDEAHYQSSGEVRALYGDIEFATDGLPDNFVDNNNYIGYITTDIWGTPERLPRNAADPSFVDLDNPAGADGIWFTPDDGLRLQSGSPATGMGAY